MQSFLNMDIWVVENDSASIECKHPSIILTVLTQIGFDWQKITFTICWPGWSPLAISFHFCPGLTSVIYIGRCGSDSGQPRVSPDPDTPRCASVPHCDLMTQKGVVVKPKSQCPSVPIKSKKRALDRDPRPNIIHFIQLWKDLSESI